ncbi:ABC transporter substrate-binding protein [Pontibacterium granulatum]|uniref:MlaC/ttg2D family ABC transporter substrate-binding protein n=1 Tax=Pontibacterium granulatum TaxID=2036029 RepID=UPI00249A08D2|nr:ABC transporter substrate-binding protein [Pontibacterium granulatum]MDI3326581.1 ABC transporter substrate-binding protein [Pontibacterium granulatum]
MKHCLISIRHLIIALLLVCSTGSPAAQDTGAKAYISQLAVQLQQALQTGLEKNLLDNDQHLDQIIDENILPYVDPALLSKRIFHPRWEDIIAAGKQLQAQTAVISSLRRTYRIALRSYNGQPFSVGDSRDTPNYSVVRITVQTGQNAHLLDFAVRPTEGDWKVFDLSVDGVVLSKTLNGAIHQELSGDSIDAIISAINPQSDSQ